MSVSLTELRRDLRYTKQLAEQTIWEHLAAMEYHYECSHEPGAQLIYHRTMHEQHADAVRLKMGFDFEV